MPQRYEILRNLTLVIMIISWGAPALFGYTRVEVVDSVTGEPVPYVAVSVKGMRHGYLTNDRGQIDISGPRGIDSLRLDLSVLGYDKKSVV
ncbi:MAG: carboxypeptidase-like regulatory domain-containing protein, partial [Muribaculaceae bacterium]|nr:carboxypeptidase-like regulatory domain-containing protein [Muribaculaceae bacterium]